MLNLLRTQFMLERTSTRNIFAAVAILVVLCGSVIYIHTLHIGDKERETAVERQSITVALSKFQIADDLTFDEDDLYTNLVLQKQEAARQAMALRMNRIEVYWDSSIKLTQLREKAQQIEGYEVVQNNLPTSAQNKRQLAFSESMQKQHIAIEENHLTYYPFILFIMSLLSGIWFIVLVIYSSTTVIDDFTHATLLRGYPVTVGQYIWSKAIISWGFIGLLMIQILVVSMGLILWQGTSNAQYPVAIYTGEFVTWPIYQVILLYMGYFMLIALFVILTTIILNLLYKNHYITIFTQMLLWLLPMLVPYVRNHAVWYPFNYVDVASLVTGEKPTLIVMNGVITISISILLLALAIRFLFTSIWDQKG